MRATAIESETQVVDSLVICLDPVATRRGSVVHVIVFTPSFSSNLEAQRFVTVLPRYRVGKVR
jgi:hypothetical protein